MSLIEKLQQKKAELSNRQAQLVQVLQNMENQKVQISAQINAHLGAIQQLDQLIEEELAPDASVGHVGNDAVRIPDEAQDPEEPELSPSTESA